MKTQELAENAELYNHELSRRVIGCAIEVHRNLGPGLLVKLLKDGIRKCATSNFSAASALSCVNPKNT